jgi:hypothetical protein
MVFRIMALLMLRNCGERSNDRQIKEVGALGKSRGMFVRAFVSRKP